MMKIKRFIGKSVIKSTVTLPIDDHIGVLQCYLYQKGTLLLMNTYMDGINGQKRIPIQR